MVLLPRAFGSLGNQTFFDSARGHANIAHFTVDNRLNALEVGQKSALGDGSDMRADAALFLREAATMDFTTLGRVGLGNGAGLHR